MHTRPSYEARSVPQPESRVGNRQKAVLVPGVQLRARICFTYKMDSTIEVANAVHATRSPVGDAKILTGQGRQGGLKLRE